MHLLPSGIPLFSRTLSESQGGTIQIVGPCLPEISKAPGCACATMECKTAMMGQVKQDCKDAIIKTICEGAPDIEKAAAINVRSLFQHLLNDCAGGTASKCDPSVRSSCLQPHPFTGVLAFSRSNAGIQSLAKAVTSTAIS